MSIVDFNEMQRVRKQFEQLQSLFQKYLPNVDTDLIYDLLTHLRDNPGITPTYTLEVYTEKEVDSAKTINFIYEITGAMATVCDNGTHYVKNQKLNKYIKEYFRLEEHHRNHGSTYYFRLLAF